MLTLKGKFSQILLATSLASVTTPAIAQDMGLADPAAVTPAANAQPVDFLSTVNPSLIACFSQQTEKKTIIPLILYKEKISSHVNDLCIEANHFITRYKTSLDTDSAQLLGSIADSLNEEYGEMIKKMSALEAMLAPGALNEKGKPYSKKIRKQTEQKLKEHQLQKQIIDEGIIADGRFSTFANYMGWANQNRTLVANAEPIPNNENCYVVSYTEYGKPAGAAWTCNLEKQPEAGKPFYPPAQPQP